MKKLLSVVCLGAMLASGVVQAQVAPLPSSRAVVPGGAGRPASNPLDFPGQGPVGPLGVGGLSTAQAAGITLAIVAPAVAGVALIASEDDATSGT